MVATINKKVSNTEVWLRITFSEICAAKRLSFPSFCASCHHSDLIAAGKYNSKSENIPNLGDLFHTVLVRFEPLQSNILLQKRFLASAELDVVTAAGLEAMVRRRWWRRAEAGAERGEEGGLGHGGTGEGMGGQRRRGRGRKFGGERRVLCDARRPTWPGEKVVFSV